VVAAVSGLSFAALALLRRRLVAVTVRGVSMVPSFRHGDRVLVRRGVPIRVGQAIVVEQPLPEGGWPGLALAPGARGVSDRCWMIKRVAAIPGDPIPRERVPALRATADARVPSGSLVLLGDNQLASFDSRHIGYFPVERVLGAVVRALQTP
jgi:signal peptidase I